MSVPIIIIGDSGTGKTAGTRTFNKGEVEIINVQNKLMPYFDPKPDTVNVPWTMPAIS